MAAELLDLVARGIKRCLLVDFTGRDAALAARLLSQFEEFATTNTTTLTTISGGDRSFEQRDADKEDSEWQMAPAVKSRRSAGRARHQRAEDNHVTSEFVHLFQSAALLRLQAQEPSYHCCSFLLHKSFVFEILSRPLPVIVDVHDAVAPVLCEEAPLDLATTFTSLQHLFKTLPYPYSGQFLTATAPIKHMVAVQGWLLGYPLVYHANADAPALCLAHQPLTLIQLSSLHPQSRDLQGDDQGGATRNPHQDHHTPFLSFTIPHSLCAAVSVCTALHVWQKETLGIKNEDQLIPLDTEDWPEQEQHRGPRVVDGVFDGARVSIRIQTSIVTLPAVAL